MIRTESNLHGGEPTECITESDTFERASCEAVAAAQVLGEETAVRRVGDRWHVLVSRSGLWKLTKSDPRWDDGGDCAEFEADYLSDDPMADFASDQDDWARSDEEGWFYAE